LVTKIVYIGYGQLKKWLLFLLSFHSCAPSASLYFYILLLLMPVYWIIIIITLFLKCLSKITSQFRWSSVKKRWNTTNKHKTHCMIRKVRNGIYAFWQYYDFEEISWSRFTCLVFNNLH
jgi:uncharacterized membrane protein